MRNKKQRWRWHLVVGFLISALFLTIAFRGLDLKQVWRSVQGASYGWLLPALLAYFATVGARTWRWHYLLRPIKPVPSSHLFGVIVIGYLANNIYPFRIGELLRVYVLRQREDVSIGAGLATVVVERVFDGVVILLLVFVALPLAPLPGEALQILVTIASTAFLGALVVFFVLAAVPERTLRLAERIGGKFLSVPLRRWALDRIGRFLQGLATLRHPGNILIVFIISIIIWLIEVLKYWFVMQAFPFTVGFMLLMLMNGIVNLATILPSAPGFVGTFDLSGIATLVLFGVEEETATAFTLVLHAVLWLSSVTFGTIYTLRLGLGWKDFDRAADMAEKRGMTHRQ